jgi:hypothetical protein
VSGLEEIGGTYGATSKTKLKDHNSRTKTTDGFRLCSYMGDRSSICNTCIRICTNGVRSDTLNRPIGSVSTLTSAG